MNHPAEAAAIADTPVATIADGMATGTIESQRSISTYSTTLREYAMIFGDRETLAVEVSNEVTGFCGASIWILNQRFGEANEIGLAATLAANLAEFRHKEHLRTDRFLYRLKGCEFMSQVLNNLFASHERDIGNLAHLNRKYGAFLLSPNLCESLDDHSIAVVSDGHMQRIICLPDSSEKTSEVEVSAGTLERILVTVEHYLNRIAAPSSSE